ncbi:hypothetical protein AB0P15_36265 [Streptomyces sp. NPDC087917]|uniref:hypothetical protein n=1 Tax=Streptomyces sp. NPDC087917 TaxID=3155060 RepID=UPI00342B2D2B
MGRHDDIGRLRTVGRTVPLGPEQARQVAAHLAPAEPGHPWEGVRFAASWSSSDTLDTTLVRPDLVAEISADRAVDRGGVWRHPIRFQRLRLDVGQGTFSALGLGRWREPISEREGQRTERDAARWGRASGALVLAAIEAVVTYWAPERTDLAHLPFDECLVSGMGAGCRRWHMTDCVLL